MIQRPLKYLGQNLTVNLRNDGDFAIANELFLERQYQFCDETIKKADCAVIDIGGHLGFFSLMAASLNAKIPIYTYEPFLGNYELLKQNLKDNRVKNVYARQQAVSDVNDELELQLSREDLNHSIIKAIEPTGETQKVRSTTLERIFQRNHIKKCDLIKLDCEGSEFKIIYGTPKELFSKIDHIFLEYHDWIQGENSNKLKNYLENLGYKVKKYPNHKMKELGFLWCES